MIQVTVCHGVLWDRGASWWKYLSEQRTDCGREGMHLISGKSDYKRPNLIK